MSTVGAVGGTVISGVASILIARGLGATERGRWAVISSLGVLIATVASSGLPVAAGYAAGRLRNVERTVLIRAGLTGGGIFGCVAAIAYLVAAAIIQPPATAATVALACLIPMASVWYSVAHQLTLTVAPIRWFALAQLLGAVVTLAVVVTLYATNQLTVLAVVIISTSGSLVSTSVSMLALERTGGLSGAFLLALRPAARVLRPYLVYGVVTFATLSLTQIVQRVDVLLVDGFRGSHAAGLYAVAVQITDLMLVIPAALGMVMFRRSARSAPTHYQDALVIFRWTAAFALTSAAVAVASAHWIIPLVFGSGYRGSISVLLLLLPGAVAFSLQSILSQYLAGRGRPRIVLIAWLIGAITSVVADVIVIPASGITGAAVVSSGSYLVVAGLHLRAFRASCDTHLRHTDPFRR